MKAKGTFLTALALLLALAPGLHAAEVVTLEGPTSIDGFLLEDLDGDGTRDVLLLEGRKVRFYPGRRASLPAPTARLEVTVPDDVSFLDALPPSESGPALLTLGRRGVHRLSLATGTTTPIEGVASDLDWADWRQATLADLVRPGGVLVLPAAAGWRLYGPSGSILVPVPADESVEPAGAFLQDTAVVTHALPSPWIHTSPDAPPALWALGGTALHGALGRRTVRYDASFLPRSGNRHLVELTGDTTPEVVHADGTNQERTWAFFRTPSPRETDAGALAPGGALRPPAAILRLNGYCMDPEFVDLDGDGFRDAVITSIAVDAKNTARALGGQVTAQTRAFLNRTASGRERLFPAAPDASVASDIGVAIRFSPAGNIDIQRSFTILVAGDLDGDGRKDLAIRTGPDHLTVRKGTPRGVWEPQGRRVGIPPMGTCPRIEGATADLDGDGRDEIVLLYRKPFGGSDRVRILKP